MKTVLDILRGVLVGIANVIPGVSGGTMMVSMGVYDALIFSLSHLFTQFKKSIKILWPYVLGMVLGIVGLSFVITFLFERYPIPTNTAFVGLILGGVPVLLPHLKNGGKKFSKPVGAVLFVLAFALIIWMKLQTAGEGTATISLSIAEVLKLLLLGVVASATMVIPGVSGSMVMMLLGYYTAIIASVKGLATSLAPFSGEMLLHHIGVLLPFGIGVVIGIFGVAKLIEMLLQKYEGLTYCVILGLVIASPVALLMGCDFAGLSVWQAIAAVVTFVLGFIGAYALGKKQEKIQ